MNPIYVWKRLPESIRSVALAGIAFLLVVARDFDPDTVTDWRAWAVGIGVGLLHAVATAALAASGWQEPHS